MKSVFLKSFAISSFGKRNLTNLELSRQTAEECLLGFDRSHVDLLILSSFAPERYTQEYNLATKLADALHLPENIFCIRTETASSSGASALHLGIRLLESGKYKNALIVGTEIMSNLSREENNIILGSVLSDTQRKFGMSMVQGAAMITNRYLSKYGYTAKDLFFISEKLHQIGSKNPKAHIQKLVTDKEYFSCPIFASPLGLYDISPISDGSACALISTEKSEFQFKGIGSGRAHLYTNDYEPSFPSSMEAYHSALNESGVLPKDIEMAELHDAFTIFEVIGAEDLGLFPRGEGLANVKSGNTHPGKKIPINSSGGLKTRGHPIGASGIAQLVELARLMKEQDRSIGITHSIGGLATNNFVTIIERVK